MAHLTDLGFTLLELGKAVDDGDVRVKTTFYYAMRNAEAKGANTGLDQSTSRKTYAQEFAKYKDNKYFFLLLDGKDILPVVWQSIRPRGDIKSLVKDEG